MALQTPEFLQTKTYSAPKLRNTVAGANVNGEGVISPGAYFVAQRGAGVNMSVDVAGGDALVRGDDAARQGLYSCFNDGVVNVAVSAAHATNPRVDRVVLQIADSSVVGASDTPAIVVIAGTATGGATLDNLTGAAAVPNTALLLADVLVPATTTTIVQANIRDRRQSPIDGFTLGASGLAQGVQFGPRKDGDRTALTTMVHGYQYGAPVFLPRRIEGATKLCFTLVNGASAPTGFVNVGIYDPSGRKIAETGAVALTGAGNAVVAYQVTIAALTLDAGNYILLLGYERTAGSDVKMTPGITATDWVANIGFGAAAGGSTLPAVIPARTAVNGIAPMVALV